MGSHRDEATKQERRLARQLGGRVQPGSGSTWRAKADVKTSRFLVEAKHTRSGRFALTTSVINKLRKQALFESRDWCLVIDFLGDMEVAVVPVHVVEELEGG